MDGLPASTHPVILSVIQINRKSLKTFPRDNDIDELFPCTELDDDITPLIASVVYQKREIVLDLLKDNGDPNACSKKSLTPLHCVGWYSAPAIFARMLLDARADPNERFPQQIAGIFGRDDVMKELLSAGEPVDLIQGTKPENHSFNYKKAQTLFRLVSIGDELCFGLRDFVELKIATPKKNNPEEVLRASDSRMLWVGNLLSVEHAVSIFKSGWITSNDEVCSASTDPAVPAEASGTHNWLQISEKWRGKLERLFNYLNSDKSKVTRIGSIAYISDVDFRIGKGSDGTEVFLGLRESDGQEIAIKRMSNTNYQVLKHEAELLRLPKLYDSCVVKYIDFAEDKHFGYLFLQLCENTLEEYITSNDVSLRPENLVYDVLDSLRALHCREPQILHRDLKPQNVLIDVTGKARLADFGISRRLPKNQTTYHTRSAGTEGWMATETLKDGDIRYKSSTDIQVAGMLIYFILSGGHHPFGGERYKLMSNIQEGKYKLDHVQDVVAKDLIEKMIDKEPKNRPRVEECLSHPFFWSSKKKVEYLRKVGNKKEVASRQNVNQELISMLDEYAEGVDYNQWRTKFSPDLVQKVDDKKKPYPENILGLLRFMRNLQEH